SRTKLRGLERGNVARVALAPLGQLQHGSEAHQLLGVRVVADPLAAALGHVAVHQSRTDLGESLPRSPDANEVPQLLTVHLLRGFTGRAALELQRALNPLP